MSKNIVVFSDGIGRRIFFTLLLICAATNMAFSDTAKRVDYRGFSVWVDCDRRGPILFHYVAQADTGNFPRQSGYEIDPDIEASCQSKTTDTFQSVLSDGVPRYDVGHQVPANHLDGSARSIAQTNYWTNLLPQTASMNRGAWLKTEEIIECVRDEVPLEIWGGPIWGSNLSDDFFEQSHGVDTPSAYWKVVIRTDNREAIAWIIANGHAPRSSIDDWLVNIQTVELVTGRKFDVANRTFKHESSWAEPSGCDRS